MEQVTDRENISDFARKERHSSLRSVDRVRDPVQELRSPLSPLRLENRVCSTPLCTKENKKSSIEEKTEKRITHGNEKGDSESENSEREREEDDDEVIVIAPKRKHRVSRKKYVNEEPDLSPVAVSNPSTQGSLEAFCDLDATMIFDSDAVDCTDIGSPNCDMKPCRISLHSPTFSSTAFDGMTPPSHRIVAKISEVLSTSLWTSDCVDEITQDTVQNEEDDDVIVVKMKRTKKCKRNVRKHGINSTNTSKDQVFGAHESASDSMNESSSEVTHAVSVLQKWWRHIRTRKLCKAENNCLEALAYSRWMLKSIHSKITAWSMSWRNRILFYRSATKIQSIWRAFLCAKSMSRIKKAASIIQDGWRKHQNRKIKTEQQNAALRIQSWWKMVRTRVQYLEMLRANRAAICIQQKWRNFARQKRERQERIMNDAKLKQLFDELNRLRQRPLGVSDQPTSSLHTIPMDINLDQQKQEFALSVERRARWNPATTLGTHENLPVRTEDDSKTDSIDAQATCNADNVFSEIEKKRAQIARIRAERQELEQKRKEIMLQREQRSRSRPVTNTSYSSQRSPGSTPMISTSSPMLEEKPPLAALSRSLASSHRMLSSTAFSLQGEESSFVSPGFSTLKAQSSPQLPSHRKHDGLDQNVSSDSNVPRNGFETTFPLRIASPGSSSNSCSILHHESKSSSDVLESKSKFAFASSPTRLASKSSISSRALSSSHKPISTASLSSGNISSGRLSHLPRRVPVFSDSRSNIQTIPKSCTTDHPQSQSSVVVFDSREKGRLTWSSDLCHFSDTHPEHHSPSISRTLSSVKGVLKHR